MIVPIGIVDIWVKIVSGQAAISTPALRAFANEGVSQRTGVRLPSHYETAVSRRRFCSASSDANSLKNLAPEC